MKKGYKNVKRRVRNDKKLAKLEIPDDFREEISQFEIPNRSRRRVKKKRKFKKSTTPEPDDIKVEEVEDEDENNSQEEEEEVEEKKEKVHKFTVKKKRPFVNITKSSTQNSAAPAPGPVPASPLLPYKAIVDLNRGAGHSAASPFGVPKIRPLISQENVDMLNPNHYDSGGGGRPRKGIKPRDVNLILRTRHSPKIIIRRYKPLFGAFMGFNLVDHKRTHRRRPHKPSRKKPCKKCKKRRKKNKFYHKFPALASDVETVHSNPSFCNQHQPQHQQHSSFPSPISNLGLSAFPFYANQPSSSVSYQYSPNNNHHSHNYNHNDYFDENLISPRLPSQPVNSYIQMPFESHYYPSETYTTLPFASTELPFSAKTEYEPTKEEISDVAAGGVGGGGGGYDVHEHENTEELAANHQQETDVNLEDENDALQYEDDNEEENPATVAGTDAEEYVENEEEESDPRWDSVFNFSKKPAQKSEIEDER